MRSAIRVFSVFLPLLLGLLGRPAACAAAAHEPSHLAINRLAEGEGAAALKSRLDRILSRLESRRSVRQADARRLGIQLPSRGRPVPLAVKPEPPLEAPAASAAEDDSTIPVLDASRLHQEPPEAPAAGPSSPTPPSVSSPSPRVPIEPPTPDPDSTPSKGRPPAAEPGESSTAAQVSASPGSPGDQTRQPAPLPPASSASTETLSASPGDHPLVLESASAKVPPPFTEALRRMMRTRERRMAEAARRGITLPSQGGRGPHTSEPLLKLCAALEGMIERAPANSPINFGVYPG